jgi:hypothetical protein
MLEENQSTLKPFLRSVYNSLCNDWRATSQTIICWRQNGIVQMDINQILNRYYSDDHKIRNKFMKNSKGDIDRHKIIALMQRTILELQPLTFENTEKHSEDDVFVLNTEFAFFFGLQFIIRWNEMYYPEKKFQNPDNVFPTSHFIHPIQNTEEGRSFVIAHKKMLTAKPEGPFPLFLIAQMWFLIEQWGLSYMRSQPGHPREK